MKALITGGDSQLGRELVRTAPSGFEVIALDIDPLDITSREIVERHFEQICPAVVINTAAYTAVDRAEDERPLAMKVNALGAENVARGCLAIGARLVQVSTDFVFSGTQSTPYRVDDAPAPLSVYGESKLAGEQRLVELTQEQAAIVRTSWLYSRFGNNFALTMLKLFQERDTLNVVDDQVGTPTWAHGLAGCLWEVAGRPDLGGLLHWSDLGVASWYDFAVALYEEGHSLGLVDREVTIAPIPSRDYPTPAARPSYSVLDKHTTFSRLESRPLHWRSAVRQMLIDLREHRRA